MSYITQAEFIDDALARKCFVSSIWGIPGFVLRYCKIDWMHASCLGVAQYVCGCAVWELFHELGGTLTSPIGACAKLMAMIKSMSKRLDMEPPIWDLTVGMFRAAATKAPKMRLKAAEGRRCLRVLREILRMCFSSADSHADTRLACVHNLVSCYEEFDNWQDSTSPLNLKRFGRRFLLLYAELNHGAGADSLMWRLYPKFHLFDHLVEAAESNPKLSWNYPLESAIGDATVIAAGCNKRHLQTALIARYAATR